MATQLVGHTPVLQQALRDLSAWVERGVAPPESTHYKIVDGQIVIPPTAAERRGVQPVVTMTADGGARAEVAAGQPVTFSAVVEVPSGAGDVVEAAWDFEGKGTFPVTAKLSKPSGRVTLEATHAFSKPGTYFPTLRAAPQRQGDPKAPYAKIQNLGRVRVVVK